MTLGNGVGKEARVYAYGIDLGPMWWELGLWSWRRGPTVLEEKKKETCKRINTVFLGKQVVASENLRRQCGFVVQRRRQMRFILPEELSARGYSLSLCSGMRACVARGRATGKQNFVASYSRLRIEHVT